MSRPAPLRLPALLLALVPVAGCSSGPTPPPDVCTTRPATLAAVRKCVFTPSCVFSSCHSKDGASAAGHLDLESNPWGALVDVAPDPVGAATRCWSPPPGTRRVVAGDPAQSFLIQKVTLVPDTDPLLGARMPNVTGQNLDAATIDQLRRWVQAGAPDDATPDGGEPARDLGSSTPDLNGCKRAM